MELRERILMKANELYKRLGIKSVSMDYIATELAISKKTIYQFYADKEALVDAVLENEIVRIEVDKKYIRSVCQNAVHEIFLDLDSMSEILSNLNPLLLHDLERYHPVSYRRFREHKDRFLYTFIKENIEIGIGEGLYRSGLNSDVLARFRLCSIFMVFSSEYFPLGKYPLNEICSHLTDNFLNGLATMEGKKFIEQYKQERKPSTICKYAEN